jgi:hypothetical protein
MEYSRSPVRYEMQTAEEQDYRTAWSNTPKHVPAQAQGSDRTADDFLSRIRVKKKRSFPKNISEI